MLLESLQTAGPLRSTDITPLPRYYSLSGTGAQLQRNPSRLWTTSPVAVQDSAPVVGDHEEAIQNAKREGRDGEEVHGGDGLAMVAEKRQPTLGEVRRSGRSAHPS